MPNLHEVAKENICEKNQKKTKKNSYHLNDTNPHKDLHEERKELI